MLFKLLWYLKPNPIFCECVQRANYLFFKYFCLVFLCLQKWVWNIALLTNIKLKFLHIIKFWKLKFKSGLKIFNFKNMLTILSKINIFIYLSKYHQIYENYFKKSMQKIKTEYNYN